jgi:NAD-dependent deacetylase
MVMHVGQSCPSCAAPSARPDIVWFGEMPYEMDTLFAHLGEADTFAAIGTSGNVYPAAGFVAEARRSGAHTIEFNLEPSAVGSQFAEHRTGPASKTVTAWVDELLGI